MQERVVLARYGEIGLKGKNRPAFEDQLVENMRRALRRRGLPDRVRRIYGRMVVPVDGDARTVVDTLRTVFGLVSVSPAVVAPRELEGICQTALAVVREALGGVGAATPRTFKVETRRADKEFPHTSLEVNRVVGGFLLEAVPGLQVDVHEPEITVNVELRREGAFLYTENWAGPGGLPLGVSGRAILLLSGGIDSPVAGWMGMKRGIEVLGLHFHAFPFTSQRATDKVVDIARELGRYGGGFRLYLCSITGVQQAIRRHVPEPLSITVLRRAMFRVAERLAADTGALALLTGESVGQVASQTLESLAAIEAATRLPVLRPLVGLDKGEIVERAKAIGTYPISIRPYEDCCTLFVPRNPKTRPRLAEVEAAESRLELDPLIEQALESIEVVET